ncbi:MAG: sugar ABC transporter permease [Ruminococcaceae bacterium]|nr:sugar ABC transporter permease [Oscillospiraceae bacterium]
MRKRNIKQVKEKTASWLYIFPSLIGVLTFYVIPFGFVIYYSLIDNVINKNFVGIENFKNLFTNSAFLIASKNTLSFSVITVTLAVVLSLFLAILLDSKIPGKSKFRTCFLSPMMVPTASIILIWQVIFSFNGSFNTFIEIFGLEPVDWMKSEYSQIVVALLFLWKNLGYNMILFMAALSNVPKDQLEAAEVDGAGAVRRFFKIKLRYISPSLFFVLLLSLINSFKIFREVYLLTGQWPYETLYFLQHFMNNTFKNLDYPKLSAAAVIMSVVIVVIIGVIFILEDKFGKDVEE